MADDFVWGTAMFSKPQKGGGGGGSDGFTQNLEDTCNKKLK